MHYINSSRGGHGAPQATDTVPMESPAMSNQERPGMTRGGGGAQSESIPNSSIATSRDGPPKEYEEIIQGLEADVRKHIRIEQQLKLHIETVEGRLDELEAENEKLLMECHAKGD